MSILDSSKVLLALPHVEFTADITSPGRSEWCGLDWYLSERGTNYCEVGSTLLVPTYCLEEVEEIIEPEKPGVPVEPYVGLSWDFMGDKRVVVEVSNGWYVVACQSGGIWDKNFSTQPLSFRGWVNYPHTPSTPAVTRKVKKWVKIDHPEVPSDGIA